MRQMRRAMGRRHARPLKAHLSIHLESLMLSDGRDVESIRLLVERHGRRFIDLSAPLVGGQVNFPEDSCEWQAEITLYESAQSPRTLEAKNISFSLRGCASGRKEWSLCRDVEVDVAAFFNEDDRVYTRQMISFEPDVACIFARVRCAPGIVGGGLKSKREAAVDTKSILQRQQQSIISSVNMAPLPPTNGFTASSKMKKKKKKCYQCGFVWESQLSACLVCVGDAYSRSATPAEIKRLPPGIASKLSARAQRRKMSNTSNPSGGVGRRREKVANIKKIEKSIDAAADMNKFWTPIVDQKTGRTYF